MREIKYLILTILCCLIFTSAFAAKQDLDEVMARKARYGQTVYTGEDAGNHYIWQPETLCWTDTNTGHEVWRVVWYPANNDIFSKEYSTEAFSADGSRIGFFNLNSARTSGDPNHSASDFRWIVNTDGSHLRASTGGGWGIENLGYCWMHTEPKSYLFFPTTASEFDGALTDALYKVVLDTNNDPTRSTIIDINDGQRKYLTIKDGITSTDSWVVAVDVAATDLPTPNDINSKKVHWIEMSGPTVQYAWGSARGCGPDADPYSNHTQANETEFRGSSSTILNPDASGMIGHYSGEGIYWYLARSGSAGDGGPDWEDWDGDSFGLNEEIRAWSDDISSANTPHNPYDNGYAGHIAPDRWGKYAHIACSSDAGDGLRWGDNSKPGHFIVDLSDNMNSPSWVDANNSAYVTDYNTYNGGHSSWTGWSDNTIAVTAGSNTLKYNDYQKTTEEGKTNYQAATTFVTTEVPSSIVNYNANPRPSQSPDGTKVAFATVLFHSDYDEDADDDDYVSLAYAVTYYPYPPIIKSLTASGGTVTVTVEWDLDGTPRGYTDRGWPTEGVSDPPPPREIENFRLWVSTDKSTWTPVKTFSYTVWDAGAGQNTYNFATGVWGGDTAEGEWSTTTTQAISVTRYYALTSIEYSGLEGRTYSNIYGLTTDGSGDGTGAQDTVYPATPGGDANFYSTAPDSPQGISIVYEGNGLYTITLTLPTTRTYVRYYNIYALDASAPTAIQQRRIASIPATADYDDNGVIVWRDWSGGESTLHGVTSVSFQGDESAITSSEGSASPTNLQGSMLQGMRME